MPQPGNWPRVAVVGAGAVGSYFGGMLARAGAPVILIGRKPFVEAVENAGLFLDSLHFEARVRVKASTELSAAHEADLVLFCVKTVDTLATAEALAPLLDPRATVVTLQNGVDNAERIRAAGIDALPAVVYVAASVPEPGHVKHVARGDLILGPDSERAKRAAETFLRGGVPCRIAENIEGELWTKLVWNCALNAISALGQASYGRIAESAEACKLIETIVEEVLAVAAAAEIVMPGFEASKAAIAGAMKIATQMAGATSSTAQDLFRGRQTEIDSLNGYVWRRGTGLGVSTPVNHALFALVKLAEGRGSKFLV